jgi:hypothetical protein
MIVVPSLVTRSRAALVRETRAGQFRAGWADTDDRHYVATFSCGRPGLLSQRFKGR